MGYDKLMLLPAAALLMLTGCGSSDKAATADGTSSLSASNEPVKRQPGSWSQSVEIVKLDGMGVKPEDKAQMQAMFSMISGMSMCVTPEMVAKEDVAKSLKDIGAKDSDCTIDKQDIRGNRLSFSSTCKGDNGGTMKLAGEGTSGASTQDFTLSTVSFKADGSREGEIVLRIQAQRNGECTDKDIKLPVTGA